MASADVSEIKPNDWVSWICWRKTEKFCQLQDTIPNILRLRKWTRCPRDMDWLSFFEQITWTHCEQCYHIVRWMWWRVRLQWWYFCDPIIIKIDYEYNLVLQPDAVPNNVKTMCLNSAFMTLYIHVDMRYIIKIKCFIRIFCDTQQICNWLQSG